MRWLFGRDRDWAVWVASQIEGGLVTPGAVAFGLVDDDGRPVAGAAFYAKSATNVFMDFAAIHHLRWATKDNVGGFLRYPFAQLGCRRVTVIIAKGNRRARHLVERIGWVLEGSHDDMLPQGTALSYGLKRGDAERWL